MFCVLCPVLPLTSAQCCGGGKLFSAFRSDVAETTSSIFYCTHTCRSSQLMLYQNECHSAIKSHRQHFCGRRLRSPHSHQFSELALLALTLSKILVNSFNRTGFVKKRSTPELNASCCALALPKPVKATIVAGVMQFSLSNLRIRLVASNPSMMGMVISIRMICGLAGLVKIWSPTISVVSFSGSAPVHADL